MKLHQKRRIAKNILYAILAAIILWQGAGILMTLRDSFVRLPFHKSVMVDIQGNVERPGVYRVAEGMSQMEILKVAGIRLNSDISPFNLLGQLDSNQTMNVGTLERPVSLTAFTRLEFYLGDVSVIAADGRVHTLQEGMNIAEGDRVIVEEKSQTELSVNSYSRIDMDNFSEMAFDKIGGDEDGKSVVEMFQKNGLCWYKMAYSQKNELYKITTPLGFVTVGGKGADFTIEVKYNEVVINNTDGLLLVQRPQTNETINLIAGQNVTIFADKRLLQVSKVAPETNINERFSKLTKAKTEMLITQMPFTFLLCGTPSVFDLISIQFDRNRIAVIRLPPQTSVSEFAQGIATLQEAVLYGGAAVASTFVERILNTRIPKFMIINKEQVIQLATIMGGFDIPIDDKAAAALKVSRGRQRLQGRLIVDFLKPSISGMADAELRQEQIFQGLFEAMKSRRVVFTALLADQMLANMETNITAGEIMKTYQGFTTRPNWRFAKYSLPVRNITRDFKTIQEPILEQARAILTEE
jgi:anionic cell wall polymer biosynthesis LytR-Cps2A-Psr (LCP) family protein